jgi:hypothetical protein
LHEAFALTCLLPFGKADLLHDLVDISDNALDDYVRIRAFRFFE